MKNAAFFNKITDTQTLRHTILHLWLYIYIDADIVLQLFYADYLEIASLFSIYFFRSEIFPHLLRKFVTIQMLMKKVNSILLLPLVFCLFTMFSCTSDKVCGTSVEALDDSAWECSQWISVADAPVVKDKVYNSRNNRAADGAACFMSEYELPAKIRSAKWMTTGLGVYELYVNGKRVGKEILKPGYTHYAKTRYSFTYDITDAFNLSEGDRNVLFAQVTPGWWADKIVTPRGNEGMRGRKCAFRGVLELTFEDGSRQASLALPYLCQCFPKTE